MEKLYYPQINETLYTETLPNGLMVRVMPKPDFNRSFAVFATDYGGADRRFSLGGEWIDTPAGIAHYLEHKMFDMPDGDNALNLLAKRDNVLLAPDTVLTPHPGEAARLLGITTAQVQADRPAAARALCERFDCVIVLKGAGTLVAAPDETPRVIAAGNPGLATGGTGDVLTGVIAALRVQGWPAFQAACTGALLHAVAGDMAALEGERGMLASDLFAPLRGLVNA